MDQELWAKLQAEPNAQKSSLEVAAEQRAAEHRKALQSVKQPITQAARDAARKRFEAITATNKALDEADQNNIVEARKAELRLLVQETLKNVSTPTEQNFVNEKTEPLLTRFVSTMSDFQVTEFVNHTLESLRNDVAARRLAGLD
jgi:hypothetical protein